MHITNIILIQNDVKKKGGGGIQNNSNNNKINKTRLHAIF